MYSIYRCRPADTIAQDDNVYRASLPERPINQIRGSNKGTMVTLARPTRIKTGSRPVVGKETTGKIHGASKAPDHQQKENMMHKVAHQIMVIYDWVSGPAMSEQERMAHKIAEAGHLGNTRMIV